jgi:hypothetical protein
MFPIAPHFIPCTLPKGLLSDSFGDEVLPFCEKHFEKKICHKFPVLKRKFNKFPKK